MKKNNAYIHGIVAYVSIVLAAIFGSAAMSPIANAAFVAATVGFGVVGLAAILRGMQIEGKLMK